MCGIAGVISSQPTMVSDEILTQMGNKIAHRGPDSSGLWKSNAGPHSFLGMIHRRLAIQDLTASGHQPMTSPSGRYITVFNGEIYNFNSLRKELTCAGYQFKGTSDTEVMTVAFDCWGVKKTIELIVGMYAFAVYDNKKQQLYLIRDRMGEKPLYYGWVNQTFFFASELKAIKEHSEFNAEIDRNALTLYFRHNFIPAPHTIYEGIYKLPPASILTVDINNFTRQRLPKIYWNAAQAMSNTFSSSMDTAVNETETLLREVVTKQLISDTPIGAFLSGGIDSSLVVALAQSVQNRPVNTFSIGFHEADFDEAVHAKKVAKQLGCHHTELYVTANDAIALVPQLPEIYDEPFADSSQIPSLLLTQMTRKYVTVALSGDGGDELFAGYSRYGATINSWNRLKHRSQYMRTILQKAIPRPILASVARIYRPQLEFATLKDKLDRDNLLRSSSDIQQYYQRFISYWNQPEKLVLEAKEPGYSLSETSRINHGDPYKALMLQDIYCYLPDDILVKVDRAAMAYSLETRVPMLDHRFVELVLSFPTQWNITSNGGKQILKNVLYRYIPSELVDRPKQGFGIPVDSWLRGPLKDWASDLLQSSKIKKHGILNEPLIQRKWQAHLSGSDNLGFELWGLLMFQAWYEKHQA